MLLIDTPKEVRLEDIYGKSASLSAGAYRKVTIAAKQRRPLRTFLDGTDPYHKGEEPGSIAYLTQSPKYMIRTKAMQTHSALISEEGDSVVPINPRAFTDMKMREYDVLLSKDSNVGEVAMVDGPHRSVCMFSGGVVRLNIAEDKWYVFAFLKHPIFKSQLIAMTPKGATIAHSKTLWLDCEIPLPVGPRQAKVVAYVGALMQAVVEKEQLIRQRSGAIHTAIDDELRANQGSEQFTFSYPTEAQVRALGRLDADIYDVEYKRKIWLVRNYKYTTKTPEDEGFTITPGPSLEIKLLGTRIDSDTPKPGFYALILPMNLSEYGTINRLVYLGTKRSMPLLRQGDILFGEAGFEKGRSIVLLEGIDNCTTNAHGLYARRGDGDIARSVFFRCVFNWYRRMRLIDLMAVGGSGGHFSPEYFNYLLIPQFPDETRQTIVTLYHCATSAPARALTAENLIEWHREWNAALGIWELDRERQALLDALLRVQAHIIAGDQVDVEVEANLVEERCRAAIAG